MTPNRRTVASRQFPAIHILLAAASVLLLQGCGDNTLKRITSELATQGAGCSTNVKRFYADLNEAHRKMYDQELVIEPEANLPEIERTPRVGITARYPDDVVNARTGMSELLENYCIQLDQVANAKDRAAADKEIDNLNNKAQRIGGDLIQLTTSMANIPTASIAALAAPIKTLTGLGIQGIFAMQRESWAKDTILKIDSSFEDVSTNLERDANNSAREATDRAERLVSLYQRRYDQRVKAGATTDEEKRLRTELLDAGKYHDSLAKNNPAGQFKVMKSKFHALADWATKESKKKPVWKFWSKK